MGRRCRAPPDALAPSMLSRVFDLLPSAPRPMRLLLPPPDATLSGDGPVTLRATGGRRPLTFLVDGAQAPAQRQASWQPPGPGFYALTVLGADGTVARAPSRVR